MVFLILANLSLALAITSSKAALNFIPPLFFISIRMFAPGILLFLQLLKNQKTQIIHRYWQEKKIILFMIIFTTIIPLLMKYHALKEMTATRFAILSSIDPIVAIFWERILLKTPIKLPKIIAVILTSMSLINLSIEKDIQSLSIIPKTTDVIVLISIFASKLGWLINANLIKNNIFDSKEITAIIMLGSGFLGLGCFVSSQKIPTLIFNHDLILNLIIATAFYSIGYLLFGESLKKYPFLIISLAGSTIPIFVAILSFLLFQQPCSINNLFSIVTIFLAIFLVNQPSINIGHILSSEKKDLLK